MIESTAKFPVNRENNRKFAIFGILIRHSVRNTGEQSIACGLLALGSCARRRGSQKFAASCPKTAFPVTSRSKSPKTVDAKPKANLLTFETPVPYRSSPRAGSDWRGLTGRKYRCSSSARTSFHRSIPSQRANRPRFAKGPPTLLLTRPPGGFLRSRARAFSLTHVLECASSLWLSRYCSQIRAQKERFR